MINLKQISFIVIECPECYGKISIPAGKLVELRACPICHRDFSRLAKNISVTLLDILRKLSDLEEKINLEIENVD